MIRRHQTLPPIPTGYPLPGEWAVIVPISRTNLISNPSFEVSTTGWTNIGGTIARSAVQQYHGVYSLAVTPSAGGLDGTYYQLTLTAGTTYAVSAKVRAVGGIPMQLAVYDSTPNVRFALREFTGTGRWQWVWTFFTPASTATYSIVIGKNQNVDTGTFYVDGVQVEAITDGVLEVTTYLDGDQQFLVPNQFPAPFGWNGTPHASTSYRTGLTRAGGYLVKFSMANLLITGIAGLSMAGVENQAVEFALLDGGQPLATRKPTRQFSLIGRFDAMDFGGLKFARDSLARYLDRDAVALDQQLILRYQPRSDCGDESGAAAIIPCKYAGGLGGNTASEYAEDVAISFVQYLPYVQSEGEAGSALSVQQSIASVNRIIQRSAGGVWSALGTGAASGVVYALAYGPDGSLYAGGTFTGMGGVANTSRIAKWDGSAWSALGTGAANNGVNAIAFDAAGNLYAAGDFTGMGGVANTNSIAKWNGSAWSAVGTGVSTGSGVYALVVDGLGNLYATGAFSAMSAVANTLRIAKWNGSAWSALGTGLNNNAFALAADKANNIYVGGVFTTANGVTCTRIAKWNGTTFVPLSTGMDAQINALAFDLGGLLHAAGNFTTAGGVAAQYAAAWNGSAWQPLNGGLGPASLLAYAIARDGGGGTYYGGTFTTANNVTLPDSFARWNGGGWTPADVDLPGTAAIASLASRGDGQLTVGFDTTGTATAAAVTTVTNPGTVKSYPTLTIKGPSSGTSRIYQIVNYTTGKAIYLNLTLNVGETAVLVFQPDMLSFTSDFQGNISGTILGGSFESDFFLAPGANSISFYAAASTVTATLRWRPAYVSTDGL